MQKQLSGGRVDSTRPRRIAFPSVAMVTNVIESKGHAASDATVFSATRNLSIERSSAGSKKSPEVPRGERRRAEDEYRFVD